MKRYHYFLNQYNLDTISVLADADTFTTQKYAVNWNTFFFFSPLVTTINGEIDLKQILIK